jgi:hypothetical protein
VPCSVSILFCIACSALRDSHLAIVTFLPVAAIAAADANLVYRSRKETGGETRDDSHMIEQRITILTNLEPSSDIVFMR